MTHPLYVRNGLASKLVSECELFALRGCKRLDNLFSRATEEGEAVLISHGYRAATKKEAPVFYQSDHVYAQPFAGVTWMIRCTSGGKFIPELGFKQ